MSFTLSKYKLIIKYAKLQFSPEDISKALRIPDEDHLDFIKNLKNENTKLGKLYSSCLVKGLYEIEETLLASIYDDANADKQLRIRSNSRKIEKMKSELFGI